MPISLFIALRYWRAKSADRFGRLVTQLAGFGITLGVASLIIVLSVMNGLESMQKRNLLSDLPHAIIAPKDQTTLSEEGFTPPDFVQHSVKINRTSVIIQSPNGLNAGQLIGVTQANDDPLLNELNVAEVLRENEFNLVMSEYLARQLGLNIGDKVRLMITENSQYTPFGRVPVQRLFTLSALYYSPHTSSEQTLFTHLNDVGRLLRLENGQVQGARLFLNDPFQVTELPHYFPEKQWHIQDWREQKGEFFQAVRMEKNMMSLLISLIIIVAVSNIVTSLSLMVIDKQGEIAILQTQGLAKRAVMAIFIQQGMLVGVIGALFGGALGLLITTHLDEILRVINPLGVVLPTEIAYTQVGLIIILSMLLSLLCTLYPAYRATQISPADALRYE